MQDMQRGNKNKEGDNNESVECKRIAPAINFSLKKIATDDFNMNNSPYIERGEHAIHPSSKDPLVDVLLWQPPQESSSHYMRQQAGHWRQSWH